MVLQVLIRFVSWCYYCLYFKNKQLAFNIITNNFIEAETNVRKQKAINVVETNLYLLMSFTCA